MRFSAVLFDVDGTLIHSQPGIFHSFTYAFEQMGVDPAGIDLIPYVGPPLRRSFAEHFGKPEDIERAVNLYREDYAREGRHLCELYPGAESMLKELHAAGLCLCTATSKPVEVVSPILREQGIYEYFDLVGGASMDSSIDTKTDVMRWVLAHELLRGKRCLMAGDRQDDMQGAADCGLPAAAALYGYGTNEELLPWAPLITAQSCEELSRKILQQ